MLIVSVNCVVGCKKNQNSNSAYDKPIVETSPVHEITGSSVLGAGVVISASGGEIIERGLCWGIQPNPTIEDNHIVVGKGIGTFLNGISELESNTTYHIRAYAVNKVGVGYGSDVSFTTTLEYGYVDLGLPSGTLFAKCNVGANKPEEFGGYYAWGETETKEDFGNFWEQWYLYKYACGPYMVNKYTDTTVWNCSDDMDYMTVLEPIDDAATINWGTCWRMPTWQELYELHLYTNKTWTTYHGVTGMLYTANNDTLFMPAGGFNNGFASDSSFYYWSSTRHPHKEDQYCAYYLRYNNGRWFHPYGNIGCRSYGYLVRPVRSLGKRDY